MTRVVVILLFFSILSISGLFAQYGLGLSGIRENVIAQKYNPANIMVGTHSKEYHGMILDYDSTLFKFGVDATGWLGNNKTPLKGVFAENGYITPETRARIVNDMGQGAGMGAGYELGYVNLNVNIKGKHWAFFLEESQTVTGRLNDSGTAGLVFFGNLIRVGSGRRVYIDRTFSRWHR